jgi:large repetitive protein
MKKNNLINLPKTLHMKWQKLLITSFVLSFLFFDKNALAQGPYPNTGDHTVCLNSTQPYGVVLNAGSTYSWTITSLTGGNGTITQGATTNLITVTWTNVGTAKLQVIETNAQGCSGDPVSIIVTVAPIPTVAVNSSTICTGTTATITATPGIPGTYNYVWTVPAGATIPGNVASFTSSVAGTYIVVITNTATGCSSASASGTVTINAAPNLVINNPSTCGSGTADLTSPSVTTGSAAGLSFTYWTDAAATIPYTTPTAAPAGVYYIKGSLAAGCFAIKAVTVTVNPAPTLVINNPAPVCSPATVDLTATSITAGSSAGLTFTYWTDAAATSPYTTPATATVGAYYIKGTAPGGCFDIKPVIVNSATAPTLVITNPPAACGTSTVDLTTASITTGSTPGLTYTYWTDAAATIVYATPATASAGTYYIKGTTAGGCFAIKPVVVTSNPAASPVITGPDPVCITVNGSTSTYSVANIAGHSYNWTITGGSIAAGQNTNAVSVTWTIAGPGSVSVTETINATGCTGNTVKTITVNAKPVTSPITHN